MRAAEGLFLSLPFLFLRDMANIRTRSLVEKKKEKEKVSSRNRKKAKKESSKSGCDAPKKGSPENYTVVRCTQNIRKWEEKKMEEEMSVYTTVWEKEGGPICFPYLILAAREGEK